MFLDRWSQPEVADTFLLAQHYVETISFTRRDKYNVPRSLDLWLLRAGMQDRKTSEKPQSQFVVFALFSKDYTENVDVNLLVNASVKTVTVKKMLGTERGKMEFRVALKGLSIIFLWFRFALD